MEKDGSVAATAATVVLCDDFSEFKATLVTMRRFDDNIVGLLNGRITTRSVSGDNGAACKSFYDEMAAGHKSRERAIQTCIRVTEEELAHARTVKEKAAKLDEYDHAANDRFSEIRSKLRMMEREVSVEETVVERSLTSFKERCPAYEIPRRKKFFHQLSQLH